jgi:hypothetical protein
MCGIFVFMLKNNLIFFSECAHVILGQNRLPRNFINVKDDGGWTPLVWACEHRCVSGQPF